MDRAKASQKYINDNYTPPSDDVEAQEMQVFNSYHDYISRGGLHKWLAQGWEGRVIHIIFLLCGSLLLTTSLGFIPFFAQLFNIHVFCDPSDAAFEVFIPMKYSPVVFAVAVTIELLAYALWFFSGLFGSTYRNPWFGFPVFHFFCFFFNLLGAMAAYCKEPDTSQDSTVLDGERTSFYLTIN